MEHIGSSNAGGSTSSASRQEQQHHQQFCLRWHNHQTSLLSTLPILLDQSHLTDVTLSAEGRTLRAHRVVLSACSTFFLELFRALDSSNHPVIIIPGASFAAIVALLTFMYSGEVNVFEEQIPSLLNLAETLGIKGLADVQSNLHNSNQSKKKEECTPQVPQAQQIPQALKDDEVPSPPQTAPPPSSPLMPNKLPTPLENFFLKSLQFYPNLIPQPLNFSQSALNKTTEFLAKYQQQCSFYQPAKETDNFATPTQSMNDDDGCNKRTSSGEKKTKDIKRIDKIVENLRCATQSSKPPDNIATQATKGYSDPRPPSSPLTSSSQFVAKTMANYPAVSVASSTANSGPSAMHREDLNKPMDKSTTEHTGNSNVSNTLCPSGNTAQDSLMDKPATTSPQPKISNSKLYATCFICHKQLSNQYNLRVHLETHQNVRYACNVCSHVSRSKDALRKHVSYRHPGAPSPCESEARRKRAKGLASAFPLATTTTEQEQMAAQLNPAFMFMPNQYHLTSTQLAQVPSLATPVTTSNTGTGSDSVMLKRESTPTSPAADHQQNSTSFSSSDNAGKQ